MTGARLKQVSFKYDPFGRRIQKSFTTGANAPTATSTNCLYDGDNGIEEVDANARVLARYIQTQKISHPKFPEAKVLMSEYRPIQSPLGLLWLHRCAALHHGPEWTRRERLLIDAGATDSRLTFRGRSIPFHGHLFKEADEQFRFTERDKRAYPVELLDELENIVNRAPI